MSFVHDIAPAVFAVVVRLGVRALPRAPAAAVVANAPTPLTITNG